MENALSERNNENGFVLTLKLGFDDLFVCFYFHLYFLLLCELFSYLDVRLNLAYCMMIIACDAFSESFHI